MAVGWPVREWKLHGAKRTHCMLICRRRLCSGALLYGHSACHVAHAAGVRGSTAAMRSPHRAAHLVLQAVTERTIRIPKGIDLPFPCLFSFGQVGLAAAACKTRYPVAQT